MASFVLSIFAIFLLPVERAATVCQTCITDGGSSCTSVKKTCAAQEICIGVYSLANLSNVHYQTTSFSRSCEESSTHLAGSFSFNFGNGKTLDFISQVCNETKGDCDPSFADDPMRIYKNGKSCRKCYRTGYDYCASDGEVPCVGDLVNCTELNGEISTIFSSTTIPFAGKGCASRSVCNIGGNKAIRHGGFTFKFNKVRCSKASGALSSVRRLAFTLEKRDFGPQVAFFFPCVLGIFAVKILS